VLFRVAQEGIRNAVHHSAASAIALRLHVMDTTATLAVVDDGIGCDAAKPGDPRAGERLGLQLPGTWCWQPVGRCRSTPSPYVAPGSRSRSDQIDDNAPATLSCPMVRRSQWGRR
jgi:hypothetical protein